MVAVNQLNKDDASSRHGIAITGETIKLDQLDLELPLASVYEGVC